MIRVLHIFFGITTKICNTIYILLQFKVKRCCFTGIC
uniref:Uncharacterized protein n=1 Tax=Siphoviridae sp. ctgn638 TaxID=2827913 RepID=A0A8S5TLN6_9CAUD|nr:MAG TPA: hypothetical protein [Siphoviridae sp. ctgn638]